MTCSILAEPLVERVLGEGAEIVERMQRRGAAGHCATSRRSPTSPTTASAATPCCPATSSSIEDGTGVVHTGVAFGEDDFRLGEENGLTIQNPVRPDGSFDERIEAVRRA